MSRSDLRVKPIDPHELETATILARPASEPRRQRWLVVAFLVALAVMAGYLIGNRPVGALQQEVVRLGEQFRKSQNAVADRDRQVQALQAEIHTMKTTCDDAGSERKQVSDLVAGGQLELAVGLAETKLSQQSTRLCDDSRTALAALWYSGSIDLLFGTARPEWPGSEVDQQTVARWVDVERKADERYHLPKEKRQAPISIAVRSYNAQIWPLADAAFRKAWAQGEVGAPAVLFRHNLLRNWGYNLAQRGKQAERAQAEEILATARAIAEHYSLPRPEACQDLVDLGHADCRMVKPDPMEPVLATAHPTPGG